MVDDIQLKQLTHAALVQYYRWYQVYEVPFTKNRIDNQKDILSTDVEIVSVAGTTKGVDGLDERLRVYEGWMNAHHVQHVEVKQLSENELALDADIIYQNIRPDKSMYSYSIHYATVLELRAGDLPIFTKLTLIPTGEIKEFIFTPAYAENRSKSFIYYWFYLMETMPQNLDVFSELLGADFTIQLDGEKTMQSLDDLKAYVISLRGNVVSGVHDITSIQIKEVEEDVFSLSMDVYWSGLSIDSKQLERRTKHEWILRNNKDERFARLLQMNITVL
jgi:hypothetical protein